MSDLVERLLGLWADPLPADDATAAELFGQLYHDPVTVNGTSMPLGDLVARARIVQAALADATREVLDVAEQPGKVAVAFRMSGRHVGPLPTSLGTIAATDQPISLRVIDILTIEDGRISRLWMVADELGGLIQVDAVSATRR